VRHKLSIAEIDALGLPTEPVRDTTARTFAEYLCERFGLPSEIAPFIEEATRAMDEARALPSCDDLGVEFWPALLPEM
jgi:hypothetical protein